MWKYALLLIASGIFYCASAMAADAQGVTFDDWKLECQKPQDAKAEQCSLSQSQTLKENNTPILLASLGYAGERREPVLVVTTPLGIDLRAGVLLRLDNGLKAPLTVQQCTQRGCVASISFDPDTLAALSNAKMIQVGMLPYGSSQSLIVNISPKGISKGMAELKSRLGN